MRLPVSLLQSLTIHQSHSHRHRCLGILRGFLRLASSASSDVRHAAVEAMAKVVKRWRSLEEEPGWDGTYGGEPMVRQWLSLDDGQSMAGQCLTNCFQRSCSGLIVMRMVDEK